MSMPTEAPDLAQTDRFRALVAKRFGLSFEDTKLDWLGRLLQRHAKVSNQTSEQFLLLIEAGVGDDALAPLLQELTVAETYFFRNADQFRALREAVLPDLLRAAKLGRRIRFLSAGCASGEEAYSIALTIEGLLPEASSSFSIRAVDLCAEVIARARRARYSAWSLRETGAEERDRWFRFDGGEWALHDAVCGAVSFEIGNLADANAAFWRGERYDVVFCRNVLMYFTPQGAQDVMVSIARCMAPGGYLFLGHAETLRGLSNQFDLMHSHGAFYYRRRSGQHALEPRVPLGEAPMPGAAPLALDAPTEGDDSWFDAINGAAERIRSLVDQANGASPGISAGPSFGLTPTPPPAASRTRALGGVFDLFLRERFAQALDLIHCLPAEMSGDLDVLLFRAVLLLHDGRIDAARDACERLLAADGMNAGAHYVLALCCEAGGDVAGATDRFQVAAYLDATFAMPHVHLGLLARRAGDLPAVRRELEQALALLQLEEPSRLLLFGGGFDRKTWATLCRAELKACEARS